MKLQENQAASTLLAVLFTILVLTVIATNVFDSTNAGSQASYQSSSWAEALNAAETGSDYATAALNATGTNCLATSGTAPPSPWTYTTGTAGATILGLTGTPVNLIVYSATSAIPSHSGLGNQKMYFKTTVDNSIVSSGTWWRIRSIGTAEVPGLRRVSYEESAMGLTGSNTLVKNHKTMLRGINYTTDLTSGYCHLPQVSRAVEVITSPATPSSLWMDAMTTQQSIGLSGGAYIDSYNSSVPAQSSTNGLYSSSTRTTHGNIASASSGSLSNLGGNTIYGSASSAGGTFQNAQNVQGGVYNNYSSTIASSPTAPTPNTSSASFLNLSSAGTLTAGAGGSSASPTTIVQMHYINISGGGSLRIVNPNPGHPASIAIVLDGQGSVPSNTTLNTSGSAYIQTDAGVQVVFYITGAVTVSGGGFDNMSNIAANLIIYGEPTSPSSNPQFTVSGSGAFIGAVYAPLDQLNISGSGGFFGSAVTYNATLSGGAAFHYDQALAGVNPSGNSTLAMSSWVEDTRWK